VQSLLWRGVGGINMQFQGSGSFLLSDFYLTPLPPAPRCQWLDAHKSRTGVHKEMQDSKTNRIILLIISLLVLFVSSLGLLVPDFYAARNNAITTFELAGQDIISWIGGAFLLWLALGGRKGNIYSIITTGLLIYFAYTFAYFLFGLITSKVYIAYMLITGLSFYSILTTAKTILMNGDEATNTKQKAISIYLIIVVVLVGLIDSKDILIKTLMSNGGLNPKEVFYILDLAFLFPGMVMAAVLNLKGQYVGRFFTGAFLIKTIALMPALILADILHYRNTGGFVDFGFDVIALVVMISAIVFYGIYQADIKRT
jgi:hypothetical protein